MPIASSTIPPAGLKGFLEASPTSSIPSGLAEFVKPELDAEKYDTPLEQLKAFGAGAARGSTFGVSDIVLPKLGVTTSEALKERKEYYPGTSFAGELTGVLGSSVLAPEFGAVGLVGKAGAATEGALASTLAPIAKGAASKILSGIGSKAAGSAVEGAFYGGGQVISEAALGDSDLNAQKVATQIGISSLLGGAFGTALGLPEVISNARGIKPILASAKSSIESITGEGAEKSSADLGKIASDAGLNESEKSSLVKGLTQLKANANEIKEAADIIGAPVLEGQLSDSKFVQNTDSMISNSPTWFGIKRAQQYQKGFEAANNAISSALKTEGDLTLAETGNAIKKSLGQAFQKEQEPISALYNELKMAHTEVPVPNKSLKSLANELRANDELSILKGSPQEKFVNMVSENLESGRVSNVDQLKRIRSAINDSAKAEPSLRHALGVLNEKLGTLEEESVLQFAKTKLEPGPITDLIAQRGAANTRYKELISKMQEIGDVIGKKKIYGPKNFTDFLEDVNPEALAKKLFTKNNSEFLGWFSKNFPQESRMLSQFEKSRIWEAASNVKDPSAIGSRAVKGIDKLSPEIQKVMFSPEQLVKIRAAQTWMDSVPANINPSGTAHTAAWQKFFESPVSAITTNLRDAAGSGILKAAIGNGETELAERFGSLIRVEDAARKTTSSITNATKSVLSGDRLAPFAAGIISKESVKEDYDDRVEKISELSNSPEVFLGRLEDSTSNLFNHAPKISSSLHNVGVNAVSFLNSKIPRPIDKKALSAEWIPTQTEMARFNRYYDMVENPVSILKQVGSGTLSMDGVEVLRGVYPKLYDSMKEGILDRLSSMKKRPNYRTRMMLSLFMGADLDNSTTPQSIAINQAVMNGPSKQKDNKPVNPTQGGMSKLKVSQSYLTPMQKSSLRENE